MRTIISIVLAVMLLAIRIASANADEMPEGLAVVAISALDGRAVVKTGDQKMRVLKVGDVIPGTRATVVQILSDKLVVEDASVADASGRGQTIWLTKSGADGKVTVQRLQHHAPPPEIREVNGMKMVEAEKSNNKDTKKND